MSQIEGSAVLDIRDLVDLDPPSPNSFCILS